MSNKKFILEAVDKLRHIAKEISVASAALYSFNCTELGRELQYTHSDMVNVLDSIELRFLGDKGETK